DAVECPDEYPFLKKPPSLPPPVILEIMWFYFVAKCDSSLAAARTLWSAPENFGVTVRLLPRDTSKKRLQQ
ncbi:hypothetical protein J6590_026999, partial [Homalodisca vitripennis]